MTTKLEKEFLRESNAIEGVYDDDSLLQAERAWTFSKKYKRLTVGAVLKTHKILMLNQRLLPNEKGYFRKRPVYIGYSAAMNPKHIEEAIAEWLNEVNWNVGNKGCVTTVGVEETARRNHIRYEKIHPFIDGNGRTGRMFWNWERMRLGLPIKVIHEGVEQYEYYDWFK
jgi:Fic family protein